MGRMSWIWKDPLKFDPTRFLNKTYKPCKYPIFNIPPRLCLGMHVALLEAKIALVKILSQYDIIAKSNQKVIYEFSVTHQMKYGFKCKFVPINNDTKI